MPRCDSCNKMVSLDVDEEPEENTCDLTFSGDDATGVTADFNVEVTINNNCADCSQALKTASLSESGSFDIDCSDYTEEERESWEIELQDLGRTEEGGGSRYSKKFYGFEATVVLKDEDGDELERKGISDSVQASSMDDA